MGVTVKVREKYQVTIPKQVRRKVPLEVGERVEVVAGENEIVIRTAVGTHQEVLGCNLRHPPLLNRKIFLCFARGHLVHGG